MNKSRRDYTGEDIPREILLEENNALLLGVIKAWEFLSGSRRTTYRETIDHLNLLLKDYGLRSEEEHDNNYSHILDEQLKNDRSAILENNEVLESELREELGTTLRGKRSKKSRSRRQQTIRLKEAVYHAIRQSRQKEGVSVADLSGSLGLAGECLGGSAMGLSPGPLDRRIRRVLAELEGERRIEIHGEHPKRWVVKKYKSSIRPKTS